MYCVKSKDLPIKENIKIYVKGNIVCTDTKHLIHLVEFFFLLYAIIYFRTDNKESVLKKNLFGELFDWKTFL